MTSRRRQFSFIPPLLATALLIGVVLMAWRGSRSPVPRTPEQTSGSSSPAITLAAPPPSRLVEAQPLAQEPEAEVFAAFDGWVSRWNSNAGASPTPDLLAEGIRLAAARKSAMWGLIASHPEAALARAVDPATRTSLPQAVVALLEKMVDGHGDFEWLAAAPKPGGALPPRPQWRVATISAKTYDAHVTKADAGRTTRLGIPLSGVAVDDRIALRPVATRVLAPGEEVPDEAPVAVAMESHIAEPPENRGTVLLRRGERVIQPCCASHATLMTSLPEEQWPVAAWGDEGATTAGEAPVAASSWTEGTKRVLAIRVDFSDLPGAPENGSGTMLNATHIANRINQEAHYFFDENSFGKTGLTMTTSDVTGTLRMPRTAQYYAQAGDNTGLRLDATALAGGAGFALADYDRVFLVFSNLGPGEIPGSQISYGGLGQIGDKFMWMNGDFGLSLVTHEMGHTYGLGHAGRWQVSGVDPLDPSGSVVEYGDEFDRMGSGSGGHPLHPAHFNPYYLNLLDWLPDQAVNEVSSGGTFRLYRYDHKGADLATTRALRIHRVDGEYFWIGYRRKYAGDPVRSDISAGAYLIRSDTESPGRSQLIDIDTPGTNPFDASLNVGQSFDDAAAGIEIQVDAAGGSGAGEYLDVTVTFDPRTSLTSTRIDVDEQAGMATLSLIRTGSDQGAVSVNWATADDTATAGTDYLPSGGTVNWAHGDLTEKTVSVPIIGDFLTEGTERFLVNFSGVSGGVFIGGTTASVYLAEPGSPDSGFSHDWFNYSGSARDIATQPDGRIALVGHAVGLGDTTVNGLARLLGDGSSDEGFLSQGEGANALPVHAIARQADGRLVIGGDFTIVRGVGISRVARLNTDGSLDSTFNPGSGPNGSVRNIAIQPDGRIVIVGHFTSVGGVARQGVARLHRDGSLDTGFFTSSPAGAHTIKPESVALQPDGKVLIGGLIYADWMTVFDGFSSGLWRLHPDGSIDTSFDIGAGAHTPGNPVELGRIEAITLQPDGKVLAGGSFPKFDDVSVSNFVRLNPNGSIDTAFRSALGTGPDGSISALLLQNDGRIVLGGTFKNFNGQPILYAARLQSSGAFDPFFDADLVEVVPNSSPAFDNSVHALALQADGKILIGQNSYGQGQAALARVFSALPGLAGTVEFSGGTYSGEEGGNAVLTVHRTGGSHGAVSISYATLPESATEGVDYPLTTGVLSWADGESGDRSLSVPLIADGIVEPVETFRVQLGIPIGGVQLGEQAIAQVSLNDPPIISVDPISLSIDHQPQTYEIAVTTAVPWTAAESLPWLAISPASGPGNDVITVTVAANPDTSPRLGTIDIAGITHTLTQAAAPPFTTLTPTSQSIDASGQSYFITVESNTDWTVSESLPWASVSPLAGTGNDTLTVTVSTHLVTSPRSGEITVGGQTHALTQQGAAPFTQLSPVARTVSPAAQSYPVTVTSNTAWSVVESLPWASANPTSGSGGGTVTITVLENPDTTERSGPLTIGGVEHLLTQQAAPASVVIDPAARTVSTAAQSYQIDVVSNTDWTVTESLPWASVSPTSGTGDATLTVTVTENTAVDPRQGPIDIGGESHSLTQEGVPPVTTIDPETKAIDATAQSYDIAVSSNTDWTVVESLPWASAAPLSGTGNGSVTITVLENPSTDARGGDLTIGGQTHTLSQAGAPPQTTIDPDEKTIDADAQVYEIAVISNTDWSVSESLDFASATPGSGNGNGTVTITVLENPTATGRGGPITIGGQTHQLTQAGAAPFLDLDPESRQISADSAVYTIEVTSNTDWTIPASPPWASVSPTEGSGNASLTVTVEANPDLATRFADIEIGSATHTLTQLGVTAFLTLSPPSRAVDRSAQTYPITVQSNAPWSVTESLDWVTVAPASGVGDSILTIELTENLAPHSRQGSLQIGGENHHLTQSGTAETVTLTPPDIAPDPAADPIPWDDSLAGIYDGVLRDRADGRTLIGAVSRLALSRPRPGSGMGGNATAALFFNGRRAILRGPFAFDGSLRRSLPQPDGSVIEIDLQLTGTGNSGEERLAGTIEWDGLIADADLPRAPFHPRLLPLPTPGEDPLDGVATSHTLLLPRETTWTDAQPGGYGWATMIVNRGGVVRVIGALGDGTRFTEAAYLSAFRSFDLFTELYRPVAGLGRGRVGGRLTLRELPGISDGDGRLQWRKHPDPREPRHADGFDLESWVLVSRFDRTFGGAPTLSQLAGGNYNTALAIDGVTLPDGGAPIDKVLTWRPNDTLIYHGPERIAGRVQRANGVFTVGYFDPTTRLRLHLRGIAFQKQGFAAGAFLLGSASGAARLQPGTDFAYPGSEDPGAVTPLTFPGAPAPAPALSPVGSFEIAASGGYLGVVRDENGGEAAGGLLGFRLNRGGGFSGQIWIGGARYPVRGAFDPDTGLALVALPMGAGNPAALLHLTLEQVDGTAPDTGYRLTGAVEIGGVDYLLAAERRPPSTTWSGAYTLVMRAPDGTDPEFAPAGDGYGMLTVTTTALCRGLLVLADGQRTALTGHLSSADEWSLYRPLYAGARGYLSGKMTFRDQPGIGQLDGELRWMRQSDAPPATVYPAGFDTRRGVIGSAYLPPAPGVRAMSALDDAYHNAWLRLAGPDFSGALGLGTTTLDRAITWNAANRLLYYGPERILLRFNPRNGLLSGRYLDAPGGINATLGGVLFQAQDLLTGAAITGGRSGLLTVEPR